MAFGAKIQITADRSAAGKSAFNQSIKDLAANSKAEVKISALDLSQDVINKAFDGKQAVLTVKKIDVSSAIADVQKQLSEMLSHLSVSNGISISGLVDYAGGDNMAKQAEKNAEAYKKEAAALEASAQKKRDAAQASAAYKAELKALEPLIQNAKQAYKSATSANAKTQIGDKDVVAQLTTQYRELITAVENYKATGQQDDAAAAAIRDQAQALVDLVSNTQAAARAKAELEKKTEQNIKTMEREAAQNSSLNKSIASQYNTVTKYISDNPKAMNNSAFASTLSNIQTQLANAKTGVIELNRTQLNDLMTQFRNVQGQINEANAAGQTFGGMLQKLYSKFGGWYFISQTFTAMMRTLKQMVSNVKELDAAMTELRKVTDATEAAYDSFFENATERAKSVGATLTDTITASADFARLGYSMSEAAELADAALIYKNIGDGIADISEASESLISTMKAFGIEAADAMTIVDKFNIVGNNFSISSAGIGEALQRSAAALASTGASLEESIALVVGMNNVIQNPEVTGTGLKTLAMYIRAAKTEAEEAGISTDGMANSVSELRQELLDLLGVDINIDDDTFKPLYQQLSEISEAFNKLDADSTKRSAVLELLGGKRGASNVASLLTNWSDVEAAMQTATNSSGSALAENEKHLDSINGKLSQLSATFESLSAHVVNSDLVKVALDVANTLVGWADAIASANMLLPALLAGFVTIKSVVGPKGGSAATTSILMVTWNEQAA